MPFSLNALTSSSMAIADVLRDRPDIFILSDEIYDRLVFDGKVFSIAALPEFKDRTIILDGFSKTYAMTGWRLGYGIMMLTTNIFFGSMPSFWAYQLLATAPNIS